MNSTKQQFIKEEFWLLTTYGGFQRANAYLENVSDSEKIIFKKALQEFINKELIPLYSREVSEEIHILNIEKLSNFSNSFNSILKNGQLNFGISQKLLNLYLKYLWCFEIIPTPPHFPVDRIIQEKLGIKKIEAWTQFESSIPYLKVIEIAKNILNDSSYTSVAQLELEIFKRN